MPSETILYLLAIILVFLSQTILQSNYSKYRKVQSVHQIRGCDVARIILDRHGLHDVQVLPSKGGVLSDYYDPTKRTVNLSNDIFYNSSIASVAVAAHEVGHALQHAEGYSLIALRNKMLPATQIASQFGWIAIFIGLFSGLDSFFWLGIILLGILTAFQVVTLPIEFNASSRAIVQLTKNGIIEESEVFSSRKMLRAAAFTYVASLISSIIQVLRLLMIRGNRRN